MTCGRMCGSIIAVMFAVITTTGARAAQDSSPQQGEAGRVAPDQRTIDGRVVGPDGGGVSGLDVLLHRVTNQGGAQLARSVTAEDGRFTLRYQPPSEAEGVYFVATRYDGRVYVGPMLRAPFSDADEYVMQVGVPGVGDVEALMRRSPSPAASGPGFSASPAPAPGAGFVAALLFAGIAIGAVLAVRGPGPSRRRSALIGLAELEEAGPSGASPSAFGRRRRELLRRVMAARIDR